MVSIFYCRCGNPLCGTFGTACLSIKFQVKLHFTGNALRLIAKKAMAKNTGARGLRAILENILTEAMFEVYLGPSIYPSHYNCVQLCFFGFCFIPFFERSNRGS